jgi:hypothetical protein
MEQIVSKERKKTVEESRSCFNATLLPSSSVFLPEE